MGETLGTLKFIIGARTTDLERGLKKSERDVSRFGNNVQRSITRAMKRVGASIIAAFTIDRIQGFVKESVQLAAETEGVKSAFDNLNRSTLLDDLRKSVKGTVSDLDLMKAAVQANNFKIPLQELATFFEFATKRAAQTGESVDYLVNSIVLGIGRKSPLILDNLGISAVELRKRLKGVGIEAASVADISAIMGDIIEEETARMGDTALTSKQKMEQLTAELANQQALIGEKLTPAYLNLAKAQNKALDSLGSFIGFMGDFFNASTWVAQTARNFKLLEQAMGRALTAQELAEIRARGFNKEQREMISGMKDGTVRAKEMTRGFDRAAAVSYYYAAAAEQVAKAQEAAKKKSKEWQKELKVLNQEIEKAAQLIEDDLNRSIQAISREGTGDLLAGTKVQFEGMEMDRTQMMDEDLEGIDHTVNQNILPGLLTFEERMSNLQVIGGMLGNLFDDMAADDPFRAMIDSVKALIAQLAQAAAISLILALATGGISKFGDIFAGLTGLKIPKLADGGVTTGPTLAMVGDNPSGKEAIIPLEKMGQIFGGMQGGGMGGGRLTATVSGTDLKFILDRTNQDFNRFN